MPGSEASLLSPARAPFHSPSSQSPSSTAGTASVPRLRPAPRRGRCPRWCSQLRRIPWREAATWTGRLPSRKWEPRQGLSSLRGPSSRSSPRRKRGGTRRHRRMRRRKASRRTSNRHPSPSPPRPSRRSARPPRTIAAARTKAHPRHPRRRSLLAASGRRLRLLRQISPLRQRRLLRRRRRSQSRPRPRRPPSPRL